MDNRALLSIALIGTATAFAGAGTYALFTDTGESSDNIFTASTLDLTLDGADSVLATLGNSNWSPGDTAQGNFTIKNAGSIEDNKVDVDVAFDTALVNDLHGNSFDSNITVTSLTYGATDLLAASCWKTTPGGVAGALADTNGNGRFDLADLESQACVDLASSNAGTKLELQLEFDGGAGNDDQGDVANLTIRVQLTQTGSEDITA